MNGFLRYPLIRPSWPSVSSNSSTVTSSRSLRLYVCSPPDPRMPALFMQSIVTPNVVFDKAGFIPSETT